MWSINSLHGQKDKKYRSQDFPYCTITNGWWKIVVIQFAIKLILTWQGSHNASVFFSQLPTPYTKFSKF